MHACPACNGHQIIVRRLRDPRVDDGKKHPIRCETCKGAGRLDAFGRPAHRPVFLGRGSSVKRPR